MSVINKITDVPSSRSRQKRWRVHD